MSTFFADWVSIFQWNPPTTKWIYNENGTLHSADIESTWTSGFIYLRHAICTNDPRVYSTLQVKYFSFCGLRECILRWCGVIRRVYKDGEWIINSLLHDTTDYCVKYVVFVWRNSLLFGGEEIMQLPSWESYHTFTLSLSKNYNNFVFLNELCWPGLVKSSFIHVVFLYRRELVCRKVRCPQK